MEVKYSPQLQSSVRKSERKKTPKKDDNFITFDRYVSEKGRQVQKTRRNRKSSNSDRLSMSETTIEIPDMHNKFNVTLPDSMSNVDVWSKVEDCETKQILSFRVLSKDDIESPLNRKSSLKCDPESSIDKVNKYTETQHITSQETESKPRKYMPLTRIKRALKQTGIKTQRVVTHNKSKIQPDGKTLYPTKLCNRALSLASEPLDENNGSNETHELQTNIPQLQKNIDDNSKQSRKRSKKLPYKARKKHKASIKTLNNSFTNATKQLKEGSPIERVDNKCSVKSNSHVSNSNLDKPIQRNEHILQGNRILSSALNQSTLKINIDSDDNEDTSAQFESSKSCVSQLNTTIDYCSKQIDSSKLSRSLSVSSRHKYRMKYERCELCNEYFSGKHRMSEKISHLTTKHFRIFLYGKFGHFAPYHCYYNNCRYGSDLLREVQFHYVKMHYETCLEEYYAYYEQNTPADEPSHNDTTNTKQMVVESNDEEKYLSNQSDSCEICRCIFNGDDKITAKISHMITAHFQGEPDFLFINGRAPFRCPLKGCTFLSSNDIDCGSHYLVHHRLIEEYTKKYIQKMGIRQEKLESSLQGYHNRSYDNANAEMQKENRDSNCLQDQNTPIVTENNFQPIKLQYNLNKLHDKLDVLIKNASKNAAEKELENLRLREANNQKIYADNIDKLNKELSESKNQAMKASDKVISLEHEINSMIKEKSTYEAEKALHLKGLEDIAAGKNIELEDLQREKMELNDTIKNLEQQLISSNASKDLIETELRNVKTLKADSMKELEEEIEKLRNDLLESKDDCSRSGDQVILLEYKINSMEENKKSFEAEKQLQMKSLDDTLAKKSLECEELQRVKLELEKKLISSEKEVEATKKNMERQTLLTSELETQVKHLNSQVEELVENLQQQLLSSNVSKNLIEMELSNAKSREANNEKMLKEKIDDLNKELVKSREESIKAGESLQLLEDKVNTILKDKEAFEIEKCSQIQRLEEIASENIKKLEDLKREKMELEEKVACEKEHAKETERKYTRIMKDTERNTLESLKEKDDELSKAKMEVANIQALRKKYMETIQKKRDVQNISEFNMRACDLSEQKVKEQEATIERLNKMNQQYKNQIQDLMSKLGIDELQLEPPKNSKFWRASNREPKKQIESKVSNTSPDSPYDVDSYAASGAAAATVIRGLISREHEYEEGLFKHASSSSELIEENNLEESNSFVVSSDKSYLEKVKKENNFSHPETFSSSKLTISEKFSPQPSQVHSTTEDFNLKIDDVRTLLPAYMTNVSGSIPAFNANTSIVCEGMNESNNFANEATYQSMQTLTFEEKLQIIEKHPEKIIQALPTKSLK